MVFEIRLIPLCLFFYNLDRYYELLRFDSIIITYEENTNPKSSAKIMQSENMFNLLIMYILRTQPVRTIHSDIIPKPIC